MKKVYSIKYILLFVLFFISPLSFGSIDCVYDIAYSNQNLEAKERESFQKKFSYDFETKTSESLSFQGHKILLWKNEQYLLIKLLVNGSREAITGQYLLNAPQIRLRYGKDIDLNCKGYKSAALVTETKAAVQMDDQTDLEGLAEKVKLELQKDLIFPYVQPEEIQLMRSLFFQDKKIKTASSELAPKMPWCALRIQLTRDENTTLNKGETLNPVHFEKFENNSYFTTFSYSFVDFSSGKKMGAQRLYNPFTFNCNFLRGQVLNNDNLRDIVGNYLKLIKY